MRVRFFEVMLAVVLVSACIGRAQMTSASAAAKTGVVMLGTGTPQARPEASGPAVAIVAGGEAYLVDAGPGVVRRAAAAAEKGIAGQNLKTVFITHLHSDHTLAHVHEIEPGVIYQDKNVKVTAFLVPHGSWDQAFGYRFDAAERSVVLSGDTGPTDVVAKACHGCDVMLNEVYSEVGLLAVHSAGQEQYFHAFHVSPREVAEEATAGKPGLLTTGGRAGISRRASGGGGGG